MPAIHISRREQYAQAIAAGENPQEAYRLAGFSTRGKGWQRNAYALRDSPEINRRIEALLDHRRFVEERATEHAIERLALSKEALARELAYSAFSNIADYTRLTGDGDRVVDFSKATREQLSAVKAIQIETYVEGKGKGAERVKRVRVILHEKLPAAMGIARLFGWIIDERNREPPTPLEQRLRQMTPAQRRQDAEAMYDRVKARLEQDGLGRRWVKGDTKGGDARLLGPPDLRE